MHTQTLQEIEIAVSQLSTDKLVSFRDWFDEFDARVWDRQFEDDAMSGKLNELARQAISDFRVGKCKQL